MGGIVMRSWIALVALFWAGTVIAQEVACPEDTNGTQAQATGTVPCDDGRGGAQCHAIHQPDGWRDWSNAMRAWMANDGLDSIVRNATTNGVIQHAMTLCGNGQCATATALLTVSGLNVSGGASVGGGGWEIGGTVSGDIPLNQIFGQNAVQSIQIMVQHPSNLQTFTTADLTVSQVLDTNYTNVIPQTPNPEGQCYDRDGIPVEGVLVVEPTDDHPQPETSYTGGVLTAGFRPVSPPSWVLRSSGAAGRWVCWEDLEGYGVACKWTQFTFSP